VLFVTHSVPEAIILSDRIVLMAAHPGRIAEIIDVDLPRPRDEAMYASDAFRDLETRVRASSAQGDGSKPCLAIPWRPPPPLRVRLCVATPST
jgi:ABC-type nitrate/sulfonate/bicarbonate transport system ATPase subunit